MSNQRWVGGEDVNVRGGKTDSQRVTYRGASKNMYLVIEFCNGFME